jgi:PIN domain nuclease of toxin-antitoxin system
MRTSQFLLLDTCAMIFIAEGAAMSAEAMRLIEAADQTGNIFLSPISAWEIGKAVASETLSINVPPLDYFRLFVLNAGAIICEMGPEILVGSSFLPGKAHKDPMDRILIETARRNNFTLVTRDRAILAYGAEGHVKTLAC